MSDTFAVLWVPNRGQQGLLQEPCSTLTEARATARRLVDAGEATMACVVVYAGGRPGRVVGTLPHAARRVVMHYLSILDAIQGGPTGGQ